MEKKSSKKPQSLAETMIKRAINVSPMAKATGVSAQVGEFEVTAPELKTLQWKDVSPEEVTEYEVVDRLSEYARALGNSVVREVGEPIQSDDEALVDIVAYCNGQIVPFYCRRREYVRVGHDELLDEVEDALEGLLVGESAQVQLTLPEDFPVKSMAGKNAVLGVHVYEAKGFEPLDFESPAFVNALKMGDTLDEALVSISGELLQEAHDAAEVLAVRQFLENLGQTVANQIPQAAIEEEASKLWMQSEGRVLMELNVPASDQDAALKTWLATEEVRKEAHIRLSASHAIWALAKRENIQILPSDMERLLEELEDSMGLSLTPREVAEGLRQKNPEAQKLFTELAYMHSVNVIIDKVRQHAR